MHFSSIYKEISHIGNAGKVSDSRGSSYKDLILFSFKSREGRDLAEISKLASYKAKLY